MTQYRNYITQNIKSAHSEALSLARNAGHRGMQGEIVELALRKCIKPFLTQSYDCGSGKIINKDGDSSSQIDLILFHKRNIPPILYDNNLGIFPIESVAYAFEIKTKITAKEIRDANEKFRSVQKMITKGVSVTNVLFAFDSDIKGNESKRYDKYTDYIFYPCTSICVLGKGYWSYKYKKENGLGNQICPARKITMNSVFS